MARFIIAFVHEFFISPFSPFAVLSYKFIMATTSVQLTDVPPFAFYPASVLVCWITQIFILT